MRVSLTRWSNVPDNHIKKTLTVDATQIHGENKKLSVLRTGYNMAPDCKSVQALMWRILWHAWQINRSVIFSLRL